MKRNRQAVAVLFLVFIDAMILAGCASTPPKDERVMTTPYYISCNVPGAQVLTERGNVVGKCPVEGEINWKGWSNWSSPYGEMIEVEKEPDHALTGTYYWSRYFLVGKIVAEGYKPKNLREYIGYHKDYFGGFIADMVDKIVINAYMEPLAQTTKEQSNLQQQQQQQQTVIVPGAGSSATITRGIVIVSSTQEDAEVYVDGAFVGNSPANLKLSEGIHIVEVKKLGFIPYKKELRVIGASEVNLRVTLEKQ